MIATMFYCFCTLLISGLAIEDPITIRIGVVLGVDNHTADTSDQEQWVTEQAIIDLDSMLTDTPYKAKIDTVFAGDHDDPVIVRKFLDTCSENGVEYVVGPRSTSTLLEVIHAARDLGLVLVCVDGLPTLPDPRDHVFRLWPSDKLQAEVLADLIMNGKNLSISQAVILSRADLQSTALINSFTDSFKGTLIQPTAFYNSSIPDSFMAPLESIKSALDQVTDPVVFMCNCPPPDITDILTAMQSLKWPVEKTRLVLTDRATPTRSVADSTHRAFSASLRTSGVLTHINSANNPAYTSLISRWHNTGHSTPLFASAVATYDAIQLSVRSSILAGKGAKQKVREATLRSTAAQSWGVGGMLSLDTAGDLYSAMYDIYEVDINSGWNVVGTVDARDL